MKYFVGIGLTLAFICLILAYKEGSTLAITGWLNSLILIIIKIIEDELKN